MNAKNPVSPKLAAVSNIPNDKRSTFSALRLLSNGAELLEREKPQNALRVLQSIKPNHLPLSARAELFEKKGGAYQMAGQFPAAFLSFQKSFAIYSSLRDRSGQTLTAQNAADVLRQLEQFSTALKWYHRAQKSLDRSTGSRSIKNQMQADIRCGIAMAQRGLGQFASAIQRFQQCLKAYQGTGDQGGVAYTLWAIGTTYRFIGRFREAARHLRQSLLIYRNLKDSSGVAFAMAGLGGTLRMRGCAAASGVLYRKANQIFSKLQDEFGLAYTYCGQGNAMRMQNRFSRSFIFMNKAVALYQKLRQHGPLGYVLWSRAQSKIFSGQYASALQDLSEARVLFHSVKDLRGDVYCDLGMGEYFRRKNDGRAALFFGRAEKKARRLHLSFEIIHAQKYHLSKNLASKRYAACGVVVADFRRYVSLP